MRRTRRSGGASSSARRRSARCATPTPRPTWQITDTFVALEPRRHPLPRPGRCARAGTRSRRSRASACSSSSRSAAARSASTCSFGVEVGDARREADLVVGADGVNSFVRRHGRVRHAVEPEGCKYVWFGTDLVFDAFTFIFRETEHGLFQVHAYPFDEQMSTFIVECAEATWRAAGLDAMSEDESRAFCEQLFADELRGRRLFSNRSLWLELPAGAQPRLASRPHRPARRRRAHRALLDRLRHEARDGGRDRARAGVRAPRLATSSARWSTTSSSASRSSSASQAAASESAGYFAPRRRATRTSSRCSSRSTCSRAAAASRTRTSRSATRTSCACSTRGSGRRASVCAAAAVRADGSLRTGRHVPATAVRASR